MKSKIKERFPQWCSDNEDYELMLTDDIDSLVSCALLKKLKVMRQITIMIFKLFMSLKNQMFLQLQLIVIWLMEDVGVIM